MSFSTSLLIDESVDPIRIREALQAAAIAQIPRHPAWVDTTVAEPRHSSATLILFDVQFSAALVQRKGGEMDEPGPPHEDGRYWCLYVVTLEPQTTKIVLSSKRAWNRDAWGTASTLLEAAAIALGGRMRDY